MSFTPYRRLITLAATDLPHQPRWTGWPLLISLTVLGLWGMTRIGIPAALLLAPMLAGICLAVRGEQPPQSSRAALLAQGLLGCMIARMLARFSGASSAIHWPLFALCVVSVLVVSVVSGVVISRMNVLPGATALWGLSPGAATAMILMADANGADAQLVAFMQYLRVILVATTASMVTRIFAPGVIHTSHALALFPAIVWRSLAETLLLALSGPIFAGYLRLPAASLLIPMMLGYALTYEGVMQIELPGWLLAAAYAVIGWRVGLRFTQTLLAHALKAFPAILASSLVLIAICALLTWLLVDLGYCDPLTAYLATSPGGADTVAIIAASSKVNSALVMSIQLARSLIVLLLGPVVYRQLGRRLQPPDGGFLTIKN